jgi:anaerobic C4-dicarboxylate transporter
VVTAAAMTQAAGGIDWMVKMAAKVIEPIDMTAPSSW